MSHTARSWRGEWSRDQIERFEAEMRAASAKPRGRPAVVTAWDDGRGECCWYSARNGPQERALRDRCRVIFGAREQAPDGGRG